MILAILYTSFTSWGRPESAILRGVSRVMRPHMDPRMLHSCRLIKFEAVNRDQVARWPIGRLAYMQLVC